MVVIDGSANLAEDVGMVDDEVLADVERELLRVLQCLEGLEELRRLILDLQCSYIQSEYNIFQCTIFNPNIQCLNMQ